MSEIGERVRLAGDPAWTPPDPEPVLMTELPCGDRVRIEPIAERCGVVTISHEDPDGGWGEVARIDKGSLRALSSLFATAAEKWGEP